MEKMPIVAAQFFPDKLCCSLCGVSMFVERNRPCDGWHFRHPGSEEGFRPKCNNDGLKFSVPMIEVRVVR